MSPHPLRHDEVPAAAPVRRERTAIIAVLVLGLLGTATVFGYGFTHAIRAVQPAAVGPLVGRPSPAAPARVTASARPSAHPTTPPTNRPVTRTETRAVVIPTDAPAKYASNSVTASAPTGRGRVITFDVRVQRGLPYDVDDVAPVIAATLNDPRSWRADGRQRFRLVDHDAELHAYLVTPDTTDRMCRPLLTRGAVSCQQGRTVVLNARRWAYAVPYFHGQVALYRQYLVNHEFGHYLGYGHVGCPGRGRRAPVMMQQTKGLDGCTANAWPYPTR